jgi:hypothetical protein
MAYKMKGSPAKLGKIQGTSGHASALKQLSVHPNLRATVSLTQPEYVPHFIQKDGKQVVNPAWSLNVNKRWQTFEDQKNKSTNKESSIDAGDTESKWNFDFMKLLDSFLTSGGGKKGLFKAAGAALQSPNERLERQEAREREAERKKRLAKNIDIEKE